MDLSIASSTWGNITKVVVKRNVEVKEVYRWTLTGSDGNVEKNSETITANGNVHNAATAPANCVGLYFYESWKVYSSAGLRNVSGGDRSLVIPNLKASDVIVFTGNEGMTTNHSAMYSGVVDGSTVTFSMENDGNFWFKMARTTSSDVRQITSIVVYRELKDVTKTITSAGWATYCSPYALDFTGDIANLTDVYIVTGANANSLELSSVKGGTVPANTGLLLEGTAGDVVIPIAGSSTTNVDANKLVGVTAATELAANGGYVLMGSPSVGFYQNSNAFTVGANTAYLPTGFDGATARSFYSFGDATGVSATLKNKEIENKEVYNLKGQRVAAPTKGLYIVNGKKVVVK